MKKWCLGVLVIFSLSACTSPLEKSRQRAEQLKQRNEERLAEMQKRIQEIMEEETTEETEPLEDDLEEEMSEAEALEKVYEALGISASTPSNDVSAEKSEMKQEIKRTRATIKTNYGDIDIVLYDDKAPKTVENFIGLAKQDKYDNVIFHRVIEGFMIQGGDYENQDGTGGKSIWGKPFKNEIAPDLSHVRGAVSMANAGPDTNGSQFFIVQKDSTFLDGGYSVFGQVEKGMEVVDKIAKVKTDTADKPLEDVVILDVIIH